MHSLSPSGVRESYNQTVNGESSDCADVVGDGRLDGDFGGGFVSHSQLPDGGGGD
jgi:hypothetical protein